jgi:uncharacterized membrane protein
MTKFTRTFLLLSGIFACFVALLFVLGAYFGSGAVLLAIILLMSLGVIAMFTVLIVEM